MRVGVKIDVGVFLCVEQCLTKIQDGHIAVRSHVVQELFEALWVPSACDKPVRHALRIDALFVRRDDEEVPDATLAQPVAATREQGAPPFQFRRGERHRAHDVIHSPQLGEKEPIAFSHEDSRIAAGLDVVKKFPIPDLPPPDELAAESEAVIEEGFEPGEKLAGSFEGRLKGRELRRHTVFIRSSGVIEVQESICKRQPEEREEHGDEADVSAASEDFTAVEKRHGLRTGSR